MFVSVSGSAHPGTPLMALNEHIAVSEPASIGGLERRQVQVAQPPVRGAGSHRDRAWQRGRQRLHDHAELFRARLAGGRFGQQQARRVGFLGRDITQRAAPFEEGGEVRGGPLLRLAVAGRIVLDPVADPHGRGALRQLHASQPLERELAVGRPRLRR